MISYNYYRDLKKKVQNIADQTSGCIKIEILFKYLKLSSKHLARKGYFENSTLEADWKHFSMGLHFRMDYP